MSLEFSRSLSGCGHQICSQETCLCLASSRPLLATLYIRLRGVRHRHPFPGLPIEHVLDVTHLYWWRRDRRQQLYSFRHDGRLRQGSCLALKPLLSRLRHASQVIQIQSQYLCPGNYRPFKVIQGNTITLAHSDKRRICRHT